MSGLSLSRGLRHKRGFGTPHRVSSRPVLVQITAAASAGHLHRTNIAAARVLQRLGKAMNGKGLASLCRHDNGHNVKGLVHDQMPLLRKWACQRAANQDRF